MHLKKLIAAVAIIVVLAAAWNGSRAQTTPCGILGSLEKLGLITAAYAQTIKTPCPTGGGGGGANCLLISGTTTNCLLVSGTTTNALLVK